MHDVICRTNLARLLVLGYLNAPTGKPAQEAWVAVMADDLGDLPPDEVDAAFAAYRKSADPADRYMPTPGRIRALTATHAATFHLGSEADGDAGWTSFRKHMLLLMGHRPTAERPIVKDPHQNAAMMAAMAAAGGYDRYEFVGETHRDFPHYRRAWIDAYQRARAAQRSDPAAVASVRVLPASSPPRQIEATRGS